MPKEGLKDKVEGNELDLSLSSLTALPPVKDMAALPKATHYDLSCNLLTALPPDFCTLSHIVKLDLSKNQLTTLPDNFGNLSKLQHLDLFGNRLRTVPVSFCQLKQLVWLDLKDNPLDDSIQSVAGDCSGDNECKNCAKRVVAYMKNVSADQERLRQRRQVEEKALDAARKQEEELERQHKKAEKLVEKERRKKEHEAKMAAQREQELENAAKRTETQIKDGSPEKKHVITNGASVKEKSPEKSGVSCCGMFVTALLAFITVFAAAYYYCETNQKDAFCLEGKRFVMPYVSAAKQLVVQYTSQR